MKLLVAVSVLLLVASARSDCLTCIEEHCIICTLPCAAGPEDPLCWACLIADCGQCLSQCFVSHVQL